MSEILGEAQIIIRADTKPFLAQIEELRKLASKPIVIPVATAAGAAGNAADQKVRKEAAATKELAAAQALQTKAALEVTAAQRARTLGAQGLISSEDRAAIAARASATANRNLQTALLGTDRAAIGAAVTTSNLARAEAEAAGARRIGGRTASDLARREEQLGRGAATAGLSFLGLRAQVLAASGAFVAGTVAAKILVDSVGAASNRTEQLNKSVEVFAGSAPDIQKWAQTTATSIGISETAAIAAAATFGGLFRTLQVGPERAAALSKSLVQLGSDLASFNNVGTDRALQAIQSGLVGQARPLRTLNIFLTQAIVKQEALNETNKKSATQLTQQDIILARYALIMRQAAIQAGDFQRTQDRLANQGRILQAQLADLSASIGGLLIPVLTAAAKDVNTLLLGLRKLSEVKPITVPIKLAFDLGQGAGSSGGGGFTGAVKDFLKLAAIDVAVPAVGSEIAIFLALNQTLGLFQGKAVQAANATRQVGAAMKDSTGAIRGLNDVMGVLGITTDNAAKSMQNLGQASTAASDRLLALKAQGAGPVAQLAAAQAKLAADQARLAATPTGVKGSATARRAIEAQIIADRAEIKSLQGEIASAATDAANKLRDARDKADQKILDAISRRQATLENLAARAEGTPGLRDDVIFAKALLTFFERTLRAVKNSALSAKAKADEIAVLTREIIDQQKRVADAVKALDDARAAAAQSARDARQTHLEAILSIAETTTQTRDDRAALTALIKFDQIQIDRINAIKRKRKLTQEEKAQLDAYRVDQAQRRQALRNLIGEQKKDNTAAREFAFLQTQQGFVSNLLGNLIPLGATGGLVGGTGGSGPSVPANVRQSLTAAQTTAQANLTRGVTSGQAETQTNLLRRILSELHRLNQGRDHPEASHQRRVGAAIMDTSGNTHGM